MKRVTFLVLGLLICGLVGCTEVKEAEASWGGFFEPEVVNNVTNVTNVTNVVAEDAHNVAGVKIDAPNLVKIDKAGKWTLGVEGGKDLVKNIFYNDYDWLEIDKGYFAYAKVTFNGCIFRCNEE